MSKWRKGPPPSIGWWPASIYRFEGYLRWWNGLWWSKPCHVSDPIAEVEWAAQIKSSDDQALIEWTDRPEYWPERSKT